jgi:hypothetical protein
MVIVVCELAGGGPIMIVDVGLAGGGPITTVVVVERQGGGTRAFVVVVVCFRGFMRRMGEVVVDDDGFCPIVDVVLEEDVDTVAAGDATWWGMVVVVLVVDDVAAAAVAVEEVAGVGLEVWSVVETALKEALMLAILISSASHMPLLSWSRQQPSEYRMYGGSQTILSSAPPPVQRQPERRIIKRNPKKILISYNLAESLINVAC